MSKVTSSFGSNSRYSYTTKITNDIAHKLTVRLEQQIRVCMKPKPKLIPTKLWMKIVAKFIYIEKTQPSFTTSEDKQ